MKPRILSLPFVLFVLGANAQVSAGDSHSLFRCSSGAVMACGSNMYGQLGVGIGSNYPAQVAGLTGITAVATGYMHSLFLKNDSTVWGCGLNASGELGDGTTTNRNIPVQVSGLTGITAVAAGNGHSLFLKNDGTVWACGWNNHGQLGTFGFGGNEIHPVQVRGLTGVIAVAAGYHHSLFLKNDGTVWGVGWNSDGQLGDTTYTDNPYRVWVGGLTGITAVEAGTFHSLFLKNDGTVWACGWNGYGQLGTNMSSTYPIQVNGLSGVTAIAAGSHHSLFLKNDSTVWACGDNQYFPVQVSALTGIIAVAGGGAHSLFLKNDGTVWARGDNHFRQLGDGTDTSRVIPVQVQNLCMVSPPVSIISGLISTELGIPIPGVAVTLSGNDTQAYITDTTGRYNFTVAEGGTYTITTSKNNDVIVNNGITAADILLMRRHILSIAPLGSPYKIIAAAECNADGNTQISTFDILFTRQLILGQITSFPINRLWQFVSSDYVFADPTSPFPFDKTRTYTNITTNQTGQDFIGIKLGDVNGSWDVSVP